MQMNIIPENVRRETQTIVLMPSNYVEWNENTNENKNKRKYNRIEPKETKPYQAKPSQAAPKPKQAI